MFLGDSITEFQPWETSFPDLDLRNEGIAGHTTEQVLERVGRTIEHRPSAVFLLTGSNDLYFRVPVSESRRHLDRLLDRLGDELPGTAVFVQRVLPREPEHDGRLQELNAAFRSVAEAHGATWIDLWPALVRDGRLRAGFEYDGVHLTSAGQEAWADVLRRYVGRERNRASRRDPPHWSGAPGPQPLRRGRRPPHPRGGVLHRPRR